MDQANTRKERSKNRAARAARVGGAAGAARVGGTARAVNLHLKCILLCIGAQDKSESIFPIFHCQDKSE